MLASLRSSEKIFFIESTHRPFVPNMQSNVKFLPLELLKYFLQYQNFYSKHAMNHSSNSISDFIDQKTCSVEVEPTLCGLYISFTTLLFTCPGIFCIMWEYSTRVEECVTPVTIRLVKNTVSEHLKLKDLCGC